MWLVYGMDGLVGMMWLVKVFLLVCIMVLCDRL